MKIYAFLLLISSLSLHFSNFARTNKVRYETYLVNEQDNTVASKNTHRKRKIASHYNWEQHARIERLAKRMAKLSAYNRK